MNRLRRSLLVLACLLSHWLLIGCDEWVSPDKVQPRTCQEPFGVINVKTTDRLDVTFKLDSLRGDADSIIWDFNNGKPVTTPGSATVLHTFPASGTYTVQATLINACGERNSRPIIRQQVVTNVVAPTVVLEEIVGKDHTSITVKLKITGDGNGTLLRYGLCWRANAPLNNPSLPTDSLTLGPVLMPKVNTSYTIRIPNLKSGTPYYIMAFAQNSGSSAGFSAMFNTSTHTYPSFKIPNSPLPGSDCTTQYRVSFQLTQAGTQGNYEFGLVYGIPRFPDDLPTLDNGQRRVLPADMFVNVPETVLLTGLLPNSAYIVRPYAIVDGKPYYGSPEDILTVAFRTCSTLEQGLVLYIPFSENGNRSYNDVKGNHAVSWNGGGPELVFSSDNQNRGWVAQFDGINDYLSVLDRASLQPGSDFSVSLWVRPQVLQPGRWQALYCKTPAEEAGQEQYSLLLAPSQVVADKTTVRGAVRQGQNCPTGTWTLIEAQNEPSSSLLTTWHHLVFVHNQDRATIYLDGQVINTERLSEATVAQCTNSNLRFGYYTARDPSFFKGYMDDIRLYNRALTGNEITDLGRR